MEKAKIKEVQRFMRENMCKYTRSELLDIMSQKYGYTVARARSMRANERAKMRRDGLSVDGPGPKIKPPQPQKIMPVEIPPRKAANKIILPMKYSGRDGYCWVISPERIEKYRRAQSGPIQSI